MKVFCTACKNLRRREDKSYYCLATGFPKRVEYLDDYIECAAWKWVDPAKNRREIRNESKTSICSGLPE